MLLIIDQLSPDSNKSWTFEGRQTRNVILIKEIEPYSIDYILILHLDCVDIKTWTSSQAPSFVFSIVTAALFNSEYVAEKIHEKQSVCVLFTVLNMLIFWLQHIYHVPTPSSMAVQILYHLILIITRK